MKKALFQKVEKQNFCIELSNFYLTNYTLWLLYNYDFCFQVATIAQIFSKKMFSIKIIFKYEHYL